MNQAGEAGLAYFSRARILQRSAMSQPSGRRNWKVKQPKTHLILKPKTNVVCSQSACAKTNELYQIHGGRIITQTVSILEIKQATLYITFIFNKEIRAFH